MLTLFNNTDTVVEHYLLKCIALFFIKSYALYILNEIKVRQKGYTVNRQQHVRISYVLNN